MTEHVVRKCYTWERGLDSAYGLELVTDKNHLCNLESNTDLRHPYTMYL